MVSHSTVFIALLVALASQLGLADIDSRSYYQGSAFPGVPGAGQRQEHSKSSVENFLNKNKNNENGLHDLLHLHHSLAIERPDQDSLVSFGPNHRANFDHEYGLERNLAQRGEFGDKQPTVHQWSNEHIDPLTGARTTSAARTVLHEDFRSSASPNGHQGSEPTGLDSPGLLHRNVMPGHRKDSVHDEHQNHLFNNEHGRKQHFDHNSRSAHSAGHRAHETFGSHPVNLVQGNQNEPVNERIHETYIDHSDPYNPKRVHYEREAKSRFGPNSATHERREILSSKSIGGHQSHSPALPGRMDGIYHEDHEGNGYGHSEHHWPSNSHGHEHKQHGRNKHRRGHDQQHMTNIPQLPPMPDVHNLPSMTQHYPFTMTPHGLSLMSGSGSWTGPSAAVASATATAAGTTNHGSSSVAPGLHQEPAPGNFDPYDIDPAHSHRSKLSNKAKKHFRKLKSRRDRLE